MDNPELFQFVDATGASVVARDKHRPRVAVCEYRNLHFSAFEAPLDVHEGFPFRQRAHPIGDILRDVFQAADHLIVYSNVARDSFLDRGVESDKISVVPLGFVVPPAVSEPLPFDPFRVVYTGRLDAYKGLDVAVAAVRRLGRPYTLAVAGPGPKEAVRWLSRFEFVDYKGILSRGDLGALWAGSAVAVCPSIESFGFAALEAMSVGIPVVTRETTGVAEYLGETATIVDGRDPSDWAESILRNRRSEPHAVSTDAPSHLTWDRAQRAQEAVLRRLIASSEDLSQP